MRGSNETYGLQNRTYIVTTILVSQCKTEWFEGKGGGGVGGGVEQRQVRRETEMEKVRVTFFIFFYDRVPKSSDAWKNSADTDDCISLPSFLSLLRSANFACSESESDSLYFANAAQVQKLLLGEPSYWHVDDL